MMAAHGSYDTAARLPSAVCCATDACLIACQLSQHAMAEAHCACRLHPRWLAVRTHGARVSRSCRDASKLCCHMTARRALKAQPGSVEPVALALHAHTLSSWQSSGHLDLSTLAVHRRHWDEAMVLAVGYGYEQATKHRVPPPSFPECTEAQEYIPYSQVRPCRLEARSV